jgi:hypothetical protein
MRVKPFGEPICFLTSTRCRGIQPKAVPSRADIVSRREYGSAGLSPDINLQQDGIKIAALVPNQLPVSIWSYIALR